MRKITKPAIRSALRGRVGIAVVAVIASFAAGCGKPDPFNKQPVSGTVKVKGQPLQFGQLFFEPAAGQQFATNATVKNGTFQLAKNEGLSPGQYSWKLQVLDGNVSGDPTKPDTGSAKAPPQPKTTTGKFDVKTGEETKLDIDVE